MKITSSIVHGKNENLSVGQVMKAEGEVFVCLDGGDLVYVNRKHKLFLWLNIHGAMMHETWQNLENVLSDVQFRKFSGTLTLEFTSE